MNRIFFPSESKNIFTKSRFNELSFQPFRSTSDGDVEVLAEHGGQPRHRQRPRARSPEVRPRRRRQQMHLQRRARHGRDGTVSSKSSFAPGHGELEISGGLHLPQTPYGHVIIPKGVIQPLMSFSFRANNSCPLY